MASRPETSRARLGEAAASAGPAAWIGRRDWAQPRVRLLVASGFGAASVLRDLVLLALHGYSLQPDSGGYLHGDVLRSRPYPVMAWLTGATAHPITLVLLQVLIAGVAVAALVWVLLGTSRLVALTVGTLFVLDLNWGSTNLTVLSEGPFMSFSVLSLAILALQFEARHRLRAPALIGAGALFAWTCTIRPSNLYLLVPIAVAYVVFTRSISKTAWLAVGMALLLLGSAWLTLVQTGYFRISGGTGYYVAFPLFSYQVFDRGNGPASAQVDTTLRTCDRNVDYSKVHVLTSNQYLWGEYFQCLRTQGWSDDRIDRTFVSAYLEAIRAHPKRWFANWDGWFTVEMGYSLNEAEAIVTHLTRPVPPLRSAWLSIVPNPNGDADVYAAMDSLTLPVGYEVGVVLGWVVITLLVWLFSRGAARVVALGAIATIAYVSATVPAGHVFLARYVFVLTPMQSIVLTVLAALAIAVAGRARQPRLRATQSTD